MSRSASARKTSGVTTAHRAKRPWAWRQLFGELVGAWLIDCWEQAGRPGRVNLVELGPGRGTLMADIMRVGRHAPDWLKAVRLHLVEINPRLRQAQAESLSAYTPQWHETLSTVPDGPIMLVANEFLDALPIRQLVFWNGAWRERLVGWNAETGFNFANGGPDTTEGSLMAQHALRVHVTREDDTCAANDWHDATAGWEGRVGADVVMTCSPAQAAAASRRRREALAGWAGTFTHDSFTWVAHPVLNRFTRLAVEMCAATGTLRVAGYEYDDGETARRATQVTTVAAA